MNIHLSIASLFLLSVVSAHALPPAPNSPDAEELAPHSKYLKGLTSPSGRLCCDISDCRLVDAKIEGNRWMVFIRSDQFEKGPDKWVEVPDTAVLRNQPNPTGKPIACWSQYSGVLCFIQTSAV